MTGKSYAVKSILRVLAAFRVFYKLELADTAHMETAGEGVAATYLGMAGRWRPRGEPRLGGSPGILKPLASR